MTRSEMSRIDFVEIVMAIEESFGIEIPDIDGDRLALAPATACLLTKAVPTGDGGENLFFILLSEMRIDSEYLPNLGEPVS